MLVKFGGGLCSVPAAQGGRARNLLTPCQGALWRSVAASTAQLLFDIHPPARQAARISFACAATIYETRGGASLERTCAKSCLHPFGRATAEATALRWASGVEPRRMIVRVRTRHSAALPCWLTAGRLSARSSARICPGRGALAHRPRSQARLVVGRAGRTLPSRTCAERVPVGARSPPAPSPPGWPGRPQGATGDRAPASSRASPDWPRAAGA